MKLTPALRRADQANRGMTGDTWFERFIKFIKQVGRADSMRGIAGKAVILDLKYFREKAKKTANYAAMRQ